MKRKSKQLCAHRESGKVRAGWRCRLPNGPQRAQGKVFIKDLVFCDVRHTSVAGNMQVFRKAHGSYRETRWHRG